MSILTATSSGFLKAWDFSKATKIRLRACYEMRCQCSHPGEAPITEYNLLSFFSDIDQIIFKNPKFAI